MYVGVLLEALRFQQVSCWREHREDLRKRERKRESEMGLFTFAARIRAGITSVAMWKVV